MGIFDGLFHRQRKLPAEQTAPLPPQEELPHIVYQATNLQGIGRRERQEDSFALVNVTDPAEISHKGLLAVLCDGMGGMADGKSASEDAVNALCELFRMLPDAETIPQQLAEGLSAISNQIFSCYNRCSGTTAVVVHIHDEKLYWLSVGDSAIYLKRNGGVFQLNREQTYLNTLYTEAFSETVIDRHQAENHEDARRLTNFVGIDHLRKPDGNIRPLNLKKGDVILLCSDGISGVLTPAELLEAMSVEPTEGCGLLETMLLEKDIPEQDNYTGILISCK